MNITEHLTAIWKEMNRYGKIVNDCRIIKYEYNGEIVEITLERGKVTRIEFIS